MNLPAKLASLRKQKGLTQMDLAEKLNISRQAISRWEVGAAIPSTDNLKVLSELYGVSVDYLLTAATDDSCMIAENQEQETKEQVWDAKSKKRRGILACALILAMAIIIVICVTIIQGREQNHFTPIGDMDRIVEDDYPVGTFSIE